MEKAFLQIDLGNVLTLLGIAIAYVQLRHNTEVDQNKRFEKMQELVQERHDENQKILTAIQVKIEGLMHLDPCLDELKDEIRELRKAHNTSNRK